MAKMKKVIVAGPLVLEAVYPAPNPHDSEIVRAAKKRLSSEAQQRMNLKYAYQKLEFEMAANFGINDLYMTLTYDEEHLPPNRTAAVKIVQNFWRRLRTQRKKRNAETRYLYVTEGKHGDERLHHHALVNATGEDYAEIQALWKYGQVSFTRIRVDSEKHYENLARYFCKEQRDGVGRRLWSGSKNLRKPEVETYRVDDDSSILPPPKAQVLYDSGDTITAYGHFRVIKFLATNWRRLSKAKPKRKKRRRKME